MNLKSKEAEEEYEKKLAELSNEIESITSHNSLEIEDYEDKVFSLEKELKKREKSINDLANEI